MKATVYRVKKTGRVCYGFPWASHKVPQPWGSAYERVVIPTTAKDNTSKKCHIQIVRRDNLEIVKEPRLQLRSV